MTLQEIAKASLPFIQAQAEGKIAQLLSGVIWDDITSEYDTIPTLVRIYGENRLRIKPEPKIRLWTLDECIGKIVVFKDGRKSMIVTADTNDNTVTGESIGWFTPKRLLEEATQLDGSPCGVKE